MGDATYKRGRLRVYLGVARPDHWFKNVLVLAVGFYGNVSAVVMKRAAGV